MLPEVKLAGNAEANVQLKSQVNVEPFAMGPKPLAVSWAPVPPVNCATNRVRVSAVTPVVIEIISAKCPTACVSRSSGGECSKPYRSRIYIVLLDPIERTLK